MRGACAVKGGGCCSSWWSETSNRGRRRTSQRTRRHRSGSPDGAPSGYLAPARDTARHGLPPDVSAAWAWPSPCRLRPCPPAPLPLTCPEGWMVPFFHLCINVISLKPSRTRLDYDSRCRLLLLGPLKEEERAQYDVSEYDDNCCCLISGMPPALPTNRSIPLFYML